MSLFFKNWMQGQSDTKTHIFWFSKTHKQMLLGGIIPFWLLRSLENRCLWYIQDCNSCITSNANGTGRSAAPFEHHSQEQQVRKLNAKYERSLLLLQGNFCAEHHLPRWMPGSGRSPWSTSGIFPQLCKEHCGSCNLTLEVAQGGKGRNFQRLFLPYLQLLLPWVSAEKILHAALLLLSQGLKIV